MESFIFKLLALIYLPVAIGFVVNKAHYKKMLKDFSENTVVLYMGGVFSLIVGFILLSLQGSLISANGIIIVLIGYIAVFKGVAMLIVPDFIKFFVKGLSVSN